MAYNHKLFARLSKALTGVGLVFGIGAHALMKGEAERNGHVLVIDFGSRPGVVDAGDDVILLDQPCGLGPARGDRLRRAAGAAEEPDRVRPVASSLLERAGLGRVRLTSNVVDARMGSSLVIIYPEHHLDWNHSPANLRLHARATAEQLRLVERLSQFGHTPVNAIEYPFGKVSAELNLGRLSERRRARLVRRLVYRDRLSLGFVMAELFPNSVKTLAVDEAGATARQDAANLALELNGEADFNPTRNYLGRLDARLRARDSGEFVGDPDLYAFFRDLLRRTADQIRAEASAICESRSRQMADAVVAERPEVAFLQVGASHVHGVRERLRELGVGYLVLSP